MSEGHGDPIPPRDISFLHSLAEFEISVRAGTLRAACKKHKIKMPAVEINYSEYPFKITICSAESVSHYGVEPFWSGNAARSPAVKNANVVIRVRYPTGLSSRLMGSKLSVQLDRELDTSDPRSDNVPDFPPYIVEVKI